MLSMKKLSGESLRPIPQQSRSMGTGSDISGITICGVGST
jgi:hypothetical protein